MTLLTFEIRRSRIRRQVHPGRLTWNLQITHLEGKLSEPNIHDYVQNVNLQECTCQ